MSVFRVEKNKNYTVMSNYHLQDRDLSLKAKGLLSFMLSLPDDWDYSLNGLVSICKEKHSSIRTTLQELETKKYLERIQNRNEKGLFEYDYIIYEKPYQNEPYIDFPHTDEPHTENYTQINTNRKNINKKDKLDISTEGIMNYLIQTKFLDITDIEIYRYKELIKELLSKYTKNSLYKSLCYVISKMKDNKNISNKFAYFQKALINGLALSEKSNVPDWLNKKIEKEKLSKSEELEMLDLLSKYKETEVAK